MLANDTEPVLYYYNPNIYPVEEYIIRKEECVRYAQKLGLQIIDDDYNHQEWQRAICGHEEQPERGSRCLECFRMRLLRAARKTRELGLETFTTTLASSRWKSQEQITEAGNWAAECAGVHFDSRNWRKGGLQQRRNELLRENGFYNQVFCGCEYSLDARLPMMGKDDLRRWIREIKRGTENLAESRKQQSDDICRKVMADGLWRSAGTVLLYHALPDEVDTRLLLENALGMDKRVLLPKVCGDSLTVHEYTGPESLSVGAYGIQEPTGPQVDLDQIIRQNGGDLLVIVPGMAFDHHGNRLGRGKGYYDRLLSNDRMYKIGICYSYQYLTHIPSEEHDIRMNEVIHLPLPLPREVPNNPYVVRSTRNSVRRLRA